jgi:hypothetical protein
VQPMARSLPKQSTLTGLAACLFTGGVVLLFVALFRAVGVSSPLLWLAALLLIATVGCWIASARAGERDG